MVQLFRAISTANFKKRIRRMRRRIQRIRRMAQPKVKVLHFLVSYLLSYTCLKSEPHISRKERFILYIYIYIYIYYIYIIYIIYILYIYIYHKYLHMELTDRYFTWILLDKISFVIFLKLSKS